MSPNPNPVKQSDYRTVINPKVRSRDILIWLAKAFNESAYPGLSLGAISGSPFYAGDVADHFGIPRADAARRLSRLKSWGCIKYQKRGKGREPHWYVMTVWGRKCAQRWSAEADVQDEPVGVEDNPVE